MQTLLKRLRGTAELEEEIRALRLVVQAQKLSLIACREVLRSDRRSTQRLVEGLIADNRRLGD